MKNKILTIKFILTIKINNHLIDYRTSKLRQNPSFLHIIYKTIWINYSSMRCMLRIFMKGDHSITSIEIG